MNVCGGFYGPSLGLADAQRSGSDVKSIWPEAPTGESATGYGPFTIKQNTLRYWMNRLWHIDPDALMVRRRRSPARAEPLSLGLLNDEEALTGALNQYLGGGIVCFTENLAEIDDDRLWLLRHCASSIDSAAIPRDLTMGARFPALFTSTVEPKAKGLPSWVTIGIVNWFDEPRTFEVDLGGDMLPSLHGEEPEEVSMLLSQFRTQTSQHVLRGDRVQIGPIAPHGCEVIKVQRASASAPRLLSTDGYFAMGATEITEWSPSADGFDLVVNWPWPTPLSLWIQPLEGQRFEGTAQTGELLRVDLDGPVDSQRLHLPYR